MTKESVVTLSILGGLEREAMTPRHQDESELRGDQPPPPLYIPHSEWRKAKTGDMKSSPIQGQW